MAENKSKAVVAGIFTLLGIILGAGLNYYFTLASEREKDLREIRKKVYIEFLDAQEKWESARFASSVKESQESLKEYRKKTTRARK